MLLAVVGAPIGIWLGVLAARAMFAAFSTEGAFMLQAVIFPSSVAGIVAIVLLVVLLSEVPPVRRVFKMDLAEATKVME